MNRVYSYYTDCDILVQPRKLAILMSDAIHTVYTENTEPYRGGSVDMHGLGVQSSPGQVDHIIHYNEWVFY